MYHFSTRISIAGIVCTLLLFVGAFQAPAANAATISDADVREQTISVQVALVDTLRQHLKLLQMVMIQRLESRVAALQAGQ